MYRRTNLITDRGDYTVNQVIEKATIFGRMRVVLFFVIGWIGLLIATMLIDHFDLSGLKQVLLFARGKRWRNPDFKTPGFYRHVRHPIYLSWIAIFWSSPYMTGGHLMLASSITVYILIAIQLEERNLIEVHGKDYVDYIFSTPMLIPLFSREEGESELPLNDLGEA